jgi:chaperone modulatory protein CbpM
MIRIDMVIARFPELQAPQIADWVARGWVHAAGAGPAEWMFSDLDIARLHLLRDLQVDLAVDEDTLPLVLSLLDQVYELRRALRAVVGVVNEAPEEVRARVLGALTRGE